MSMSKWWLKNCLKPSIKKFENIKKLEKDLSPFFCLLFFFATICRKLNYVKSKNEIFGLSL